MAKKANIVVAADPESATTQVNIAEFQRTRDSVIVALATLQSSVQDLSRAYINHANTVVPPGRGGELNANLTNILTESGLLGGSVAQPLAVVEDAAAAGDSKKKRKRVPHDPNAPKRALTPYFLYMQSARTQIAKELGDNAKPKEVADEGTRRWTEMEPAEKHVWDELYQKNLAVYRVRMAAYKAGLPVPEETEAVQLVEAGKAPEIIADLEADEEEIEPEVVEESSPEPIKEPSPPKSKRRKSEKVASPVAKETPKSTTKSSSAKSKKAATKKEASPVPEPASTSKPSEKKKRGKKA